MCGSRHWLWSCDPRIVNNLRTRKERSCHVMLTKNVFLHNVRVICLSIATFAANCYNKPSRLFVFGGTELKSSEGTTQGDPFSGLIYVIAVIPMILRTVADLKSNRSKRKLQGMLMTFSAEANSTPWEKCGTTPKRRISSAGWKDLDDRERRASQWSKENLFREKHKEN